MLRFMDVFQRLWKMTLSQAPIKFNRYYFSSGLWFIFWYSRYRSGLWADCRNLAGRTVLNISSGEAYQGTTGSGWVPNHPVQLTADNQLLVLMY